MKRALFALFVGFIFAGSAPAQTAEEKKATIAFVQGLQTADGGFQSAPSSPTAGQPNKPSLRATSSALRALKYFGGEAKDRPAAAKFVERCFDKTSGAFFDSPPNGKPDLATTAIGLMALVELKMPTEPYVDPAVKYLCANAKSFEDIRIAAAGLEAVNKQSSEADNWLAVVAKLRNPNGSYGTGKGTARSTGGAVALVLRLGGKVEPRQAVVKAMVAGQQADGGWCKEDAAGSDLETSYRVMRSLMMLKAKPDEPKIRGFVAKCRNGDGGYGVAPGQPSNVGGTYFAAAILHWLDEK